MSSAKEEVRRILDRVSNDASLEGIQHRIYVCQKIERGLEDVEAGRLISQDEVEKRMGRWLRRWARPGT
jgi:predicted transcriptional regulator